MEKEEKSTSSNIKIINFKLSINTMKILIIADVHGDLKSLSKIIDNFNEKIDLVICPGDFIDMFNIPEGFSGLEMGEIILQKLFSLNKKMFCVPGNHDPYDIIDLFEEYGVNIHHKRKTFREMTFIGFGGAETPFNTNFEPTEDEIEESLNRITRRNERGLILITHNPPFNTKLDKLSTGEHVGSNAIREFIKKKKPILAISAHIHESIGKDKIGSTVLFYPGPVFNGYYGIVEIEKGMVRCQTKKV